jgi:hypothetical protein
MVGASLPAESSAGFTWQEAKRDKTTHALPKIEMRDK